ncbi:MAG TPA: NADH-ubiquinone oxidoreductase-F iron-sulfur binding region domain-containing protein [Ramlibacter sp.]|nr:NADH-ubiquinone oxidoreductase-F iron-sulfur binding region domain-containing protein [Ramlibacter sp.]
MSEPNIASLASVAEVRQRLRHAARARGRPVREDALAEVRALIGPRPDDGHRRDLLIEYLHRINDAFGALPRRHLVALAREMRLGMAEVYEVASFYHHFDVLDDDAQPPRLTVRVCEGLSCTLAGAPDLEAVRRQCGPDVRVVAAPCIGRCEQAPAVLVGQQARGHADVAGVAEHVARACQAPATPGRAEGVTGHLDFDAYRAQGGYALVRRLATGTLSAEEVLAELEHSGLRGLGGAGFPAGRKWRIVREQPAPRLMAVNIDEGEPGTFKDRHYLERDPHRFLEGMLLAASVVGIDAIYIYLRDEYHDCRVMLEAELARLRDDPPCPLPRIELRRGAGAYICGEESAMIESIEGRRGEPRLRPPYLAQVGLFGRPTLEHNFETLYWVRALVERGGAWFAGQGRHGRKGLRSFSVSGRVRVPGVHLAPAGITLRELVDEYCGGMAPGHELYAYLPGGASGGILPAALADVPLDFDTLQPHGCFIGSAAVIVLSQHDRARDAALAMMRFFADESCGQCTPCRVGTAKAARLMEAQRWDRATLDDLSQVMADASICGLGQAAPNPLLSVQKYFAHEIE